MKAREANLDLRQKLLMLAYDLKAARVAMGIEVKRAQIRVQREKQDLLVAHPEQKAAKLNVIRGLGIDFALRLFLTDDLALRKWNRRSLKRRLQRRCENRPEPKMQDPVEKASFPHVEFNHQRRPPALVLS